MLGVKGSIEGFLQANEKGSGKEGARNGNVLYV
jgi:hypothetical protein